MQIFTSEKILVLMQICIIIVNVTLEEVFMSPQQMILSLLDKKITQEQIAKYVGVDQSTISRYAKGQNPTWHIAEKIKEAFEKLSKDEAIDIGAVGTLFDIEITFNNTNAFTADDSTKIIRLVGCKITSDGLETSSTSDATIQHGYKFLFKTIASGT